MRSIQSWISSQSSAAITYISYNTSGTEWASYGVSICYEEFWENWWYHNGTILHLTEM